MAGGGCIGESAWSLERCETPPRVLAPRPIKGGVVQVRSAGEKASETAAPGWSSTMERKLRPSSRSTNLAGGKRFSLASATSSIAMSEGQGIQNAIPYPSRTPIRFFMDRISSPDCLDPSSRVGDAESEDGLDLSACHFKESPPEAVR